MGANKAGKDKKAKIRRHMRGVAGKIRAAEQREAAGSKK